jgi:UDP-N-acetylmuramate: L-alanyl-gamma-D-glutamyl-meso-diaminopimelate ligase
LSKLVPRNGYILANRDDPNLEPILHVDWAPVLRVGLGDRADLKILNYEENEQGSSFDLEFRGKHWTRVKWAMWGLFNARNAAMAAMSAALASGLKDPTELDLSSLAGFRGVKRRQEVIAETDQLTLITDFAHHPTAVLSTIKSLRGHYPDRKLIICFEARSNTACRNIHETEFELAFDRADEIHLGAIFRAERYADSDRIDLPGMAARLGEKACAHASNEALEQMLLERLPQLNEAAVVVFFSNGSFDGVPQRVSESVAGLGIDAEVSCEKSGQH